MRRIGVIAGLAAAVTALAVLVDSGRLEALDRFARSHLSPLQAGPAGRGRGEPLQLIAGATDAIISVAGIAVSVLLVTLAARRLARAGRAQPAGLWLGALAAGFAIELAAKAVVQQQQPDARVICRGLGAGGFDASFPSGHALRSMILAGMAAALWPHLRRRFVLAALGVDLALQLNGIHALSDIVAGALVGASLWLAVEALSRRLPPRSVAAPQSAPPAAVQPASG